MLVKAEPVTIDGQVYKNYILQMSISDVCMGTTKNTNVNATFKPVRIDEDGNYIVCEKPEYWKQPLFGDVADPNVDTDAQICFGKCLVAIQEYLTNKGI